MGHCFLFCKAVELYSLNHLCQERALESGLQVAILVRHPEGYNYTCRLKMLLQHLRVSQKALW